MEDTFQLLPVLLFGLDTLTLSASSYLDWHATPQEDHKPS